MRNASTSRSRVGEGDDGHTDYLTWATPPEFKSRNVMTDDQPLRRAVQPRSHRRRSVAR